VINPQMINGQQTTRTLHGQDSLNQRASILVRVIAVRRDTDGGGDDFETLVSRIVAATNSQNAIRPSDLMANDRIQIQIQRELRKLGYHYIRKRQSKGEAKREPGMQFRYFITKEELAQAVAACEFDPKLLREGKERLFEERYYGSIFSYSNPLHYLAPYWLVKKVSSTAKGFPERAYAKWLVVHFMWSQLVKIIQGSAKSDRFRRECERSGKAVPPLVQAIDIGFTAALRFYRHSRGKGKRAIDVSSFFRLAGLHHQFESFWRASGKISRRNFVKALGRFEKAMND